jgi:hypothetical protein
MAGKKPDQFGPGITRGPYNTCDHYINLLNTGETGFSKNPEKINERSLGACTEAVGMGKKAA